MSGVNEIRTAFLEYFGRNGHEIVASGPLVPHNDPTLLFTNAGMVQFKNVFTGLEKRPYDKAVTSQKCVRAGGKHNDLDNVGYTARHHTFFEMLGNFSFGDYFKERAIELAWNLVRKEFDLPAERLLATVYAQDEDAFELWRKISGLPESRILKIATSDNFWAMGDTGPCGPCSELFFDHGDKIPGGPPGSADEDGDRFIEIWNLVFMQYEQVTPEKRVELPKPSIDTGMGLERIAAVLQGTHDNYRTDLFRALIEASVEASGVPDEGEHDVSHRVIADHLRASSFLIADGVLPANEGRGYVLRRIMRRGMRHAQLLGTKEPLMWRLVPALVRQMGQAFPELARAKPLVEETLRLEEVRFRKTLERGLKILDEETAGLKAGARLKGEVAFMLYDTYGFPFDLTEDALRAREITVDKTGFDAAMERQREEARKAWKGSGDAVTEKVWFDVQDETGVSEFLGYTTLEAEGIVRAIVADGVQKNTLETGAQGALVVNQTPFYAEAGGQVGDRGTIKTGGGVFEVTDTVKRAGGLFVHIGKVAKGTLRVGDDCRASVNKSFRDAVRVHHSATHLLHEALRETLGEHVVQKGSLVDPARLRFDFSHAKAMSADQIERVETIVNAVIDQNAEVSTRLMNVDEAIELGAMALFGEKYAEEVRVVTMGRDLESAARPFSIELCGGTHVSRTGDIGLLKLVSEGAVASGVRRVEAVAGARARALLGEQDRRVREASALLKSTPQDMTARIAALLDERRSLERELARARRDLAMREPAPGGEGNAGVREVRGISFMSRILDGVSPKDLRGLVDEGKRKIGSGIVVFLTRDDGKASLAVGVTDDLTCANSAVDLVRAGAEALGGQGVGGRPDMAQAGGPDATRARDALAAIERMIG